MTFLDMWVAKTGNNDADYNNKKYDSLIKAAQSELNPDKRSALLHEAEDYLMADMPVLPLYFYVKIACINPVVKNVAVSPLGQYYFKLMLIINNYIIY